MKDKIAVVTGGMGGIGTSICQKLQKDNFKVIATYHRGGNHQSASEWQNKQSELGFDFDVQYVDVKDFESCKEMVQQIEKNHGQIQVLVNNAGITRDCALHKMNPSQWNEVLRTNLDSVFNVTRNVIDSMIKNKYGRIVNISSINGQMGQYGQSNYAAAKAGMHGFTKSIAIEVAKHNITINTISPGYIATDMVMAIDEDIRNKIIGGIPTKRFGKPEEIARCVSFLVSTESSYITGSNLMINGGQYLM